MNRAVSAEGPFSDVEVKLGYVFRNPALLAAALTHPGASTIGDNRDGYSFERLEFLGDRIVGLVLAETLLGRYPEEPEGHIAKRHAALVRREAMAEVMQARGLDRHLFMGPVQQGRGPSESVLSDACEALIAALYCDGGLDVAKRFILDAWSPLIEGGQSAPPRDPKTALQEWVQARGLPLPVYRVVDRSGPDHAPRFVVAVEVRGQAPESAVGPSKRIAEKEAAAALFARLETTE